MNILILEDDEDLAVGIEISLKQENYKFVTINEQIQNIAQNKDTL